MGLGSLLKSAGSPAVRIHTDAKVTIRLVIGRVPGLDEVTFAVRRSTL
jgi:hypothetical protein